MRASHPLRPNGSRHGFTLIEVLVSLTILGIAVAACLRSYTQSLSATTRMEVQTQAVFFGRELLQEFEVFPPESDLEGGFGDAYRNFSWRVRVEYDEPRYRDVPGDEAIDRYFSIRKLHLEIHYDDGVHRPFAALELDTAVVGFEKFDFPSKFAYANY